MCMKALLFPAIISLWRLSHQVVVVFLYILFYQFIADALMLPLFFFISGHDCQISDFDD